MFKKIVSGVKQYFYFSVPDNVDDEQTAVNSFEKEFESRYLLL